MVFTQTSKTVFDTNSHLPHPICSSSFAIPFWLVSGFFSPGCCPEKQNKTFIVKLFVHSMETCFNKYGQQPGDQKHAG